MAAGTTRTISAEMIAEMRSAETSGEAPPRQDELTDPVATSSRVNPVTNGVAAGQCHSRPRGLGIGEAVAFRQPGGAPTTTSGMGIDKFKSGVGVGGVSVASAPPPTSGVGSRNVPGSSPLEEGVELVLGPATGTTATPVTLARRCACGAPLMCDTPAREIASSFGACAQCEFDRCHQRVLERQREALGPLLGTLPEGVGPAKGAVETEAAARAAAAMGAAARAASGH